MASLMQNLIVWILNKSVELREMGIFSLVAETFAVAQVFGGRWQESLTQA